MVSITYRCRRMIIKERGIRSLMKKLRTRILTLILLPTLMIFIGLILYVSINVQKEVEQTAEEMLYSHGERLSGYIEVELGSIMSAVKTISQTFETYIERGIRPEREEANMMLQQLLESNDSALSTWMYWEKDAFDGKDDEFVNEEGHDHTGQFIPAWSKEESGNYFVEPVQGYDEEGSFQTNLNLVFNQGQPQIWEPFHYSIQGEEYLITSIVYPVIIDDEVIGVTGVNMTLEKIDEFIRDFTFYESGFAGFITANGNILSHENNELIGENYYEIPALLDHPLVDDLIRDIIEFKQVLIEGDSEMSDEQVFRMFTPLEINEVVYPWATFIVVPINEAMAVSNSLLTVIYISAIIVVLGLTVIILAVTRNIVNPIEATVRYGERMAQGDFSTDLEGSFLKRKDELGELARIFSVITNNMRSLIGNIQSDSEALLDSANTVKDSSDETSEAVTKVVDSVEELTSSANQQKEVAVDSVKSMEDMSSGVQRVADAASMVSESAYEMRDRAVAGGESVESATEQMNRIKNETSETKSVIESLRADADRIGAIIDTITDISEQTNLLALNAAIEAARAGESGQGFAVVADEVRVLADETKDSAVHIRDLIKLIQNHTLQADQSMDSSMTEVAQGIEEVKQLGSVFEKITTSIDLVAKEIEELAAVSEEMSATSEEVLTASEQIASSAENSAEQTDHVATLAQEQLASMEEMQNVSYRLQELVDNLNEHMSRFKI